MNYPIDRRPVAHVPTAAAVSGGLAVLLAAGLGALGIVDQLDGLAAAVLLDAGGQAADAGFSKALPEWVQWTVTTVLALGLALAMLSVAGAWRRVVLWLSTLLLVAAWAPVLALAAHAPQVSAAFTAVLWTGLCVWFYARTHILPCESAAPLPLPLPLPLPRPAKPAKPV